MTPELTAILGSGLLMIEAGAGFLLKRMITGRHHVEDAESIEQVVRIKSLREAEGRDLVKAGVNVATVHIGTAGPGGQSQGARTRSTNS